MASSVFLLARLTYLTEAVPIAMRARALSTLGGCTRAGMFIGPFCAAALMPWLSLDGAYWVAIAAMLGVGALAFSLPELTVPQSRAAASAPEKKPPAPRLLQTFREHRRAYLTLGLVGAMVNGIRSCRQVTIPLWGLHIGLDPATTTLIYGMMGAMDLLLFYPSGRIMDLRGRRWVAVPSMLLMSGGFAWMIMSSSTLNFALSCMMIGVGNGMGAGLIMTIGADVSPPHARTQFLGGWRFLSDAGSSAAPILVSAIAAAASLALGISLIAAVGLFTAGLFWRWLPKDNKPARVP
jgi:MFS family permease